MLLSITEQTEASDLLSVDKRTAGYFKGMELNEIIRQARLRKGLTQRALAALIGVNHSAVAQWEKVGGGITDENMATLKSLLDIEASTPLSGSRPYPGELVEDPDELALLRFWRSLGADEKRVLTKRLFTPPIGPNASTRK